MQVDPQHIALRQPGWVRQLNLPVKATGPEEGRVDDIGLQHIDVNQSLVTQYS